MENQTTLFSLTSTASTHSNTVVGDMHLKKKQKVEEEDGYELFFSIS